MKRITYIVEITTHWRMKEWKVSVWGKKSTCLLACLPAHLVSTKKFSAWVYWKLFSRLWLIKLCDLSHVVWVTCICSEFSSIIPDGFAILIKSRRGVTFLCLASSVNVQQKYFFPLKTKYPSLIFLVWTEQFWIWLSRKLTKNVKIFIVF